MFVIKIQDYDTRLSHVYLRVLSNVLKGCISVIFG